MATPFQELKEGLTKLSDFFTELLLNIGSMLQWLNPLSEDFFLNGLFTFLGNVLSYINPFSENFFAYKLIDLTQELLEFLFIPKTNPFEELSVKMEEKFAFVNQIKDLFSSLLGFNNYGYEAPTFNMTWKGVTFALIDFSLFLEYRIWLHGIILAIAWFVFIFKTFKKLPVIIGGFSQ